MARLQIGSQERILKTTMTLRQAVDTQSRPHDHFKLTDRRLKVCHVVCSSEGATWMVEQLRDLRNRYGYEVTAVVSANEGKLIDRLRTENIPYHVTHFATGAASFRTLVRLPISVLSLARYFRRERFDIVQSHVFATAITARPAAWLADVPVRLAMIASPFHLQARFSREVERATFWMESKLIPSCYAVLDLCREIGVEAEKLAPIIYYGPDEKNFDPDCITPAGIREKFGWPANTPIVCKVAYFYHRMGTSGWIPEEVHGLGHKGHEDLVKAAPLVLAEFPDTKFLLVGSGWGSNGEEHLQEIRELVRHMDLERSVIFTGYRADANRILHESDVAVQASLNENLGGTIEALMIGRPMVATRVGGMIDAVRNEETGVLANPADPPDLARAILELLRDSKRAAAMGHAGRALMLDRFSLRRTVEDLASLYQQLLSKRQPRNFYSLRVSLRRLPEGAFIFAAQIVRLLAAKLTSLSRRK
ncbi:MAG TPA: glycosyltransferase family 4 protein [Pyrinomonadaceae bacterium]|nr:glycosyltransferase family 4 protein [Pyrinomonadaceae bacterium]